MGYSEAKKGVRIYERMDKEKQKMAVYGRIDCFLYSGFSGMEWL